MSYVLHPCLVSNFDRVRLLVRPMGLTLSCQLLTTSATSQWRQRSFMLSFVIAGTRGGTETETYTDAESFGDAFQGFRFTNPQTADLPKYHMDSSVVYIAKHPLLTARFDKWSPNEVTDKVFVNKACMALEHHRQPCSVWRCVPNVRDIKDGWRILTRKDVVEWEGSGKVPTAMYISWKLSI